ncbi:MAG: TIGR02147 family protein [Chitinispirillaceae bacterium]|nr:TIGR02147 family protein [Chitinispirillaceae bacterium]
MRSVFEYTDYRKYLSDFYAEKKASNRNYSHRFIAKHVGFKSGGHFSLILSGKANISIAYIERLADFLKLSKSEIRYFQNLVLYNQAKKHEDKKRYFKQMMSCKEALVRIVDAARYEYFEKWYYSAIRELLVFYPFSTHDGFEKLGRMLVPAISTAEAKQAFNLLKELQLISPDGSGCYRPVDTHLSSGERAASLAVNNFMFNALDIAKQSVDRFSKEKRSYSWVTLSLSEKSYRAILDELHETRRRIMKISQEDEQPDRVYLLSHLLFPLSREYSEKEARHDKERQA